MKERKLYTVFSGTFVQLHPYILYHLHLSQSLQYCTHKSSTQMYKVHHIHVVYILHTTTCTCMCMYTCKCSPAVASDVYVRQSAGRLSVSAGGHYGSLGQLKT